MGVVLCDSDLQSRLILMQTVTLPLSTSGMGMGTGTGMGVDLGGHMKRSGGKYDQSILYAQQ